MNFCVENIGTSISCNQVESDGNEATKLLQEDPFSPSKKPFQPLSSRGFLADYFVRCPVTLSIKFPTCIEISHIIITPKLGSQTASAFLLETITSYKVWTRGTVTDSPISKFIVAKEYLNPGQQIPRQIIFCNPRYQPRPPFSRLSSAKTASSSSSSSNSQIIFNLKHPSSNACERVIGLDVTILRSVGSSTPCLGGIEIWGQPCQRCPPEIVNKLLVTWLRRNRKPIINTVPNPEIEKKNLKSPFRNNSSTDDDDEQSLRSTAKRRKIQLMESANKASNVPIPEEFLDTITYEIMVQPIRLPCGIAVDSSTLQKFYMEEAVWGRKPSDPFTGQPYTDFLKPVVDTPLKIRIDKFLTQNYTAMNLQSLPRTVGTGKAGFSSIDHHRVSHDNLTMMMRTNPKYSLLSQTAIHNKNLKRKINSNNNDNNNNSDSSTSSTSPPPPPLLNIMSGKLEKTSTVTSASVLTSEISNNTNLPSPTTSQTTTIQTMEDKLQKELAKILGNDAHSSYFLPKSSISSSSSSPLPLVLSDQSYQTQKCIKCSKTFISDCDGDIFYTTAKMSKCSHIIICRNCLLALDKQIPHNCSICQTEWDIKDLNRMRK